MGEFRTFREGWKTRTVVRVKTDTKKRQTKNKQTKKSRKNVIKAITACLDDPLKAFPWGVLENTSFNES